MDPKSYFDDFNVYGRRPILPIIFAAIVHNNTDCYNGSNAMLCYLLGYVSEAVLEI